MKMEIIRVGGWVFYVDEGIVNFDEHKVGKWMYYFDNYEFVSKICEEAVKTSVVCEAKHSDAEKGVACFYLNSDDIEGHKKVLQFFIDNNLIRRTKTGRLYNISFKLDDQTRAGEYGSDFKAEIKLDTFINLETGEWKVM